MKIVPYEFIKSIQNEVDDMHVADSQNLMQKIYLEQPNLTEYIVAVNRELDDELNKYVLYTFNTIYYAVERFYQKEFPVISDKTIIKCHEENEALLESLQTSLDIFITRLAEENYKEQPGIYKFITKTIFEDLREISDITEDEKGWIFLVLKSIVDALNEKNN